MYETEAQIDELQSLLDHSYTGAGPHLAAITTPEKRLNARQVVRLLQGTKHVAFATVNSRCEPYVAPLDGLFLWGRFYVGTDGRSLRAIHLRNNTAVSLTHFQGDEYSIVVHGQAIVLEKGDAEAERVDAIWQQIYGSSAYDLGEEIIFIRVEPRRMFTFAHHPESFPQ